MEIDRVQRGHDQDAREQTMDPERRVQHTRRRAGKQSRQKAGRGGRHRPHAADHERCADGGAEGKRAVRRNIGKVEDPETDEDTQGKQGHNQPDRQRPDQQLHAMAPRQSERRSGPPSKPHARARFHRPPPGPCCRRAGAASPAAARRRRAS